jgi:hypothetical protein
MWFIHPASMASAPRLSVKNAIIHIRVIRYNGEVIRLCFTRALYYNCMKRTLGTLVLFVLLLLTVVAIKQIDAPQATTIGSTGEAKHATN